MHSRQEKNFPVIPTAAGPIKICTLWDFMNDVRIQKLHPDVAREVAVMRKQELNNFHYQYGTDLGSVSKSIHTLKQNPMRIIAELKKTTTTLEFKGKSYSFLDVLHDTVNQSITQYGLPTHLFSIGKSRYALVSDEDVVLFVKNNYEQSLVCIRSQRNFNIYAPNLKLEF